MASNITKALVRAILDYTRCPVKTLNVLLIAKTYLQPEDEPELSAAFADVIVERLAEREGRAEPRVRNEG